MRILALPLAAAALLAPAAGLAAEDDGADPWFGPDKAKHFGASAALAGGGYALGAAFFDHTPERLATGAGISLTAGVAKELADLAGAGSASWRDLAWDVAGTAAGLLVAWGIDAAFFSAGGSAAAGGEAAMLGVHGRF